MRPLVIIALLMAAACEPTEVANPQPDAAGHDAGWVNPDGGIPTGDCNRDHQIIAEETARMIAPHRGPCVSNSECTLIERSIPCSGYCREAVLADAGEQLRSDIVAYGQDVCGLVACVASGVCPAFDTAVCHEGACRRGFSDGGLAP